MSNSPCEANRQLDAVIGPIEDARTASVDVCRWIAVVAVVCLHVQPFHPDRQPEGAPWWGWFYPAIEVASRFAVPFFFCLAGYFWGKKIRRGTSLHAATFPSLGRLFLLFAFWELFYFLVNLGFSAQDYLAHRTPSIQSHAVIFVKPLMLLGGGFGFHLWFLPALMSAYVFAWIFLAIRQPRLMVPCAAILYGIGVLSRSYAHTRFGIELRVFGVLLDGRNGPFFSSLLFVSGYVFSGGLLRRHWKLLGPVLLTAGLLLHAAELKLLPALIPSFKVPLWNQDFAFGTYGMGVGAALISLAYVNQLTNPLLASWGRMALGIYGVHLFFARLLYKLVVHQRSALVELGFLFAVLLLSTLFVHLVSKVRPLRRLVQ